MTPSDYVEATKTEGLRKALAFGLIFGSILLALVVYPIASPQVLEGLPWDSTVGAYLLFASPWMVVLGPFRGFWRARILRARPVRTGPVGIVFPARWLGRDKNTLIRWEDVKGVGNDFRRHGSHFRMYWTIWLALRDGRVINRPYIAGEDGDNPLAQTLAEIQKYVAVTDRLTFMGAVGLRRPSKWSILALRLGAFLSVPLALVVVGTLYLGRLTHGGGLVLGSILLATLVFAIPLWLWSRNLSEAAGLRSPGGG